MSTWPIDGSTTGYAASEIGPVFLQETLGWFDPTYPGFGAKMDLRPVGVTSTTGGSAVLPGVVTAGANGDIGKRMLVRGAGSILASGGDGAVTIGAPARDNNLLTSAGGGFTSALNGRRITITGAGPGATTFTGFIWGVVSSTQLRLTRNASTTASGCTFIISDDLYGSVVSNGTDNWVIDAVAGISTTNPGAWVATDDSTAINACIQAAITSAATMGIGPTIYFPRPCGIGESPILVGGKCRFQGSGTTGFSALLGTSGSMIRGMKPLNSLIRAALGGSGNTGVAGCGMGVRGSITSGTAVLTDPDASWVPTDIGKRIAVVGAATQVGSQTQVPLSTTIISVDSPTQVTLAANAGTTVVEGVYSWVGSGVAGGFNWFSMERLHVIGSAGQRCAFHPIGTNGLELKNVTFSDFRAGVEVFVDTSVGGITETDFYSCEFNNARVGVKGGATFSGRTLFDGNDNIVGVMPPVGTLGIDGTSLYGPGVVALQAYETLLRSEGRANMKALRLEAFQTGVELAGDGSTGAIGGSGHQITAFSWSTSNTTGSSGQGLVLKPGVQKTTFEPGFYVTNNINMYGGSDAASLLTCVANDPNILTPQTLTFASSLTPDLSLGAHVKVTLTGNVTAINVPINVTAIPLLTFEFVQDGTGGRTVSGWNAVFGTPVWTPVTTASSRNTISFRPDGSNWIQCAAAVGV